MPTILVRGGNFGGMTSAFELRRKLGSKARVVVVSRQKEFVYIPSLIWVPFGRRTVEDITFSAEETLRKGGIEFVFDEVMRIEPERNTIRCTSGRELAYDFLIVATGADLVWDSVPGLGPTKYTNSIFTPRDAEATYAAFQQFVKAPGPAVIDAVPGASCMGAGYEYLFNFDRHVRKHGIRDRVPITWVTPEPVLGHFRIGGIRGGELMLKAFLKWQGIDYRANAAIKEVTADAVILESGERLPAQWKMLVPAFKGARVIRESPGLGDEKGFVPTDNKEVWILTNRLFPPRQFAMMLPNVFGDWMKVLVEKTLMLKYRHGWSFLP